MQFPKRQHILLSPVDPGVAPGDHFGVAAPVAATAGKQPVLFEFSALAPRKGDAAVN